MKSIRTNPRSGAPEGDERIRTAVTAPGADPVYDRLGETCRQMTDEQLRGAIEAIRGNPKRAGARARMLGNAESIALLALMAEEARRVRA